MDTTKGLVAAAVLGGLYLASKSSEKTEQHQQDQAEPTFTPPPRPVEQVTISPYNIDESGLMPQGQFANTNGTDANGMLVLGQTAFGRGELRYEQKVSGQRLMERLKQGDKAVFEKPFMARDVNVSAYRMINGGRVKDTSKPSALDDARQKRMTIGLDDWDQYRFFSTLLAVGYLSAQSEDKAKKTYGYRLLDWFHYHRWYIGKPLQEKMLQAAHEASCRYKYSRGPGHKHRNYLPHYTQKIDQWGQTIDTGISKGTDRFHKHYPAIDDWGLARDGRYPLRDTQDFAKKIPRVPLACWAQESKSPAEVKDRLWRNLGLAFWGIDSQERASAGPCGAMIEYAAARYMQASMCAMIDPKLGEAAGGALLGALKTAGGVAIAAIGAAIAGASTVPVAGWIVAGLAAIAGAIGGAVGMSNAIAQIQKIRKTIATEFDSQLKQGWQRYGVTGGIHNDGVAGFSGHRLKLLIPNHPGAPIDDQAFWSEITDPLFSHYAMSTTRGGFVISVPQLPPHYLGIDFPLPIGVKQPDNTLMTLLPICSSGKQCQVENSPHGAWHMDDGCPICEPGGEVREDCPGGNATVVGFRDCAFPYPMYGRYLQKAAMELRQAIQTTQDAYQPTATEPTQGTTPNAPTTGPEKDNSPLYLAAAVAGTALLLAQTRS